MRICSLALLLVIAASRVAEAGPYDPALRFFTHRTPHFRIHYHRGEGPLAGRLAEIAEATHVRLSTAWGLSAARTTDIVLVDQADLSNGTASVVPRNQIVIYPVPPSGAASIGNTDDWLEYVFTHEYAHILHLDRSRGWARVARALFGRSELAFPNLTLPLWQIEGLATLTESADGAGRLHDGDFRQVVDAAGRSGRLEPIDRVNGGLIDWPSGQGWYAYGARFHQYLAQTYGEQRLHALSERTAGRLPFLTAGAFRNVYGKSLGSLWREFQDSVRGPAVPQSPGGVRRLTAAGYLVDGPREARDGSIYFTATDASRFPAIYRISGAASTPTRVVSRYGGETLSLGERILIFDQLEIARGAALVSDLYAHDLSTGRTRRLTHDARLLESDLSLDGQSLAAIQITAGARALVVLDAARLLQSAGPLDVPALPILSRLGGPDDVMAAPRFSPDGRLIAVERRRRGGPSTIALLDARTLRTLATLEGSAGERYVQAAFASDGTTLFFAAGERNRPFEIRAVDLGPGGRVTAPRTVLTLDGGARAPLPTRDGRLVVVGYGVDGYDLYEGTLATQTAMERRHTPEPQEVHSDRPCSLADETAATGQLAVQAGPSARDPDGSPPYRPLASVIPRGWIPLIEQRDDRWRIGGATLGSDVLARHVIAAAATWAIDGDDAGLAPRSRPDWDASYTYQRWQPSFYLTARDRTTLFDVAASGGVVRVAQREQTLDVGVWRPIRRIRWVQTALVAYHVEALTQQTAGARSELSRAGLRTAWSFTSARRYGYSISQQDGVTVAATGEVLRSALGSDGRSDAITTDVRAYLPTGVPHAVLAVRAAMAASSGDDRVQRRFRLGGADGNPDAGAFGSDAISLLRGFQNDVFVGNRVALVNVEARVPIRYVQRGWGTWPLFLRAVHAAAFLDAGHAWTGRADWSDMKVGYGAELSADVVAGFGLPLTWTAGIGWGRDGAGVVADARSLYFRVGRSF